MASRVVLEDNTSIRANARPRKRRSAAKTAAPGSKEPAQSSIPKMSILSLLCAQESVIGADPEDSASPPSNLSLEDLASAVGCGAVLQNFRSMVEILNTPIWSIDMSIESAARLLNYSRANAFLALLQDAVFSLCVARKFRDLVAEFRGQATIRRRESRRRAPRFPSGKRGVGAESYAYDQITNAWGVLVEDDLRHVVVDTNRRGIPFLKFEEACGPEHPLWILLLARSNTCPLHGSFQINLLMYQNLDQEQTNTFVEMVRTRYPRLWESLTQVKDRVDRLLRGENVDFGFLRELEMEADEPAPGSEN